MAAKVTNNMSHLKYLFDKQFLILPTLLQNSP